MKKAKLFTRDFSLIVIGQIISLFGNAILRFALPLYLLRETGSAALFGLVSAGSFLPMIVLSFLGGVLADRVNKRNIMVVLDFLTAGVATVIILALELVPVVPLVLVSLMILYGISGTYQPTVQASIPALMKEEKILSATAVINQVSALASLLGPIIGGVLFGVFGIKAILLVSIGCFFVSAVMEIFIRIPFTKRPNQLNMFQIVKQDLRDSMNYIRKENPCLIKLVLLIAGFNLLLAAMMMVGVPILVVDTLKLGDQMLGIAQGALALGGLAGGALTAVLGQRLQIKNAHIQLFGCSAMVVFIALPLVFGASATVSFAVLIGACFVAMIFSTMFSIQIISVVQLQTPADLVGKVIALMMSISMCAQPIGQAIYGVLFEALVGKEGFLLIVVSVVGAFVALWSKKLFTQTQQQFNQRSKTASAVK